MRVLHVLWQIVKHLNYRGYIYVWANLLWIALTLCIITAPAAWAGLMILTYRAHTQAQVNFDDFWDGFKKHFWRAMLNAVISLVIIIVNISNLLNYSPVNLFGNMIALLWILSLIVWLSIQLYLWVIIEESETPSLWLAYRNALVMTIHNPLLTLVLCGLTLLTILLSIFLPPLFILLTGSIITIIGVAGALECLKRAGYENLQHQNPLDNQI